MPELEGQQALFETGDVVIVRTYSGTPVTCVDSKEWIDWIPWNKDDEVCDECGTTCTSSKECVQISGLYD